MLKLYWNIGSQPARAVKALLQIGKIKHETIEMDLKNNETRTPQFLKLNPFGQIPFIVTENGFGIGESNAIMQYLCQKYHEQLLKYYGNNLQAKTQVNTFLSWYQAYYRVILFSRIKVKVYGTIKKGIPHTEQQIKTIDKMTNEALGNLNNFLKKNTFVAGENLSIADLLVYFETTNLIYYGMQGLIKNFDNVENWYSKMEKIPEVKEIQEKWSKTVPQFKAFLESAKPESK